MAFLALQTRLVVRTLPSTALTHNRQRTGKDDSATQNQLTMEAGQHCWQCGMFSSPLLASGQGPLGN